MNMNVYLFYYASFNSVREISSMWKEEKNNVCNTILNFIVIQVIAKVLLSSKLFMKVTNIP